MRFFVKHIGHAITALVMAVLFLIPVQAADLTAPQQVFIGGEPGRATLLGTKEKLATGETLEIRAVSVNGLPLLGLFGKDEIPSGQHAYKVEVEVDEGFLGAVYKGEATVVASLIDGGKYRVIGEPAGQNVNVWFVDERSGVPVSDPVAIRACRSPTILSSSC